MKKYILCSVIALGSLSCTDSFSLKNRLVVIIMMSVFLSRQR